jgi:bifunctional ADP-heptose synthase (sugar kinase/adenylyltransferase)
MDLALAIEIASVAAGLVISKMGTATINIEELRAGLQRQEG